MTMEIQSYGDLVLHELNLQNVNRDFAVELVDDYGADMRSMLIACLKWMSEDDVKNMLEANEYPSTHNKRGWLIGGTQQGCH